MMILTTRLLWFTTREIMSSLGHLPLRKQADRGLHREGVEGRVKPDQGLQLSQDSHTTALSPGKPRVILILPHKPVGSCPAVDLFQLYFATDTMRTLSKNTKQAGSKKTGNGE
ncbi:hypothetical protein R3I93_019949 [Phoxinus phoxinus]|uniref:Uncharacterized protein n=1 Tax=Phoxinus phoxinus TaxID=58324 RepID=A0AAN9CDA2_9TELE